MYPPQSVTSKPPQSVTYQPSKSVTSKPRQSVTYKPLQSVTYQPPQSVTSHSLQLVTYQPPQWVMSQPTQYVCLYHNNQWRLNIIKNIKEKSKTNKHTNRKFICTRSSRKVVQRLCAYSVRSPRKEWKPSHVQKISKRKSLKGKPLSDNLDMTDSIYMNELGDIKRESAEDRFGFKWTLK
jgi:hypothetical protein